jgi:hypothetical protein
LNGKEVGADTRADKGHRWQGRPWTARTVRVLVLLVPFAASVGVAFVLSRMLPAAPGPAWLVARLVVITAAATVALRLMDRAMRRLLPLATLLDLTLLFPDQAPSRYRMALRSGASNLELQERIDRYTRSGESGTASAAGTITKAPPPQVTSISMSASSSEPLRTSVVTTVNATVPGRW